MPWDETPYVDALVAAAHPRLRRDESEVLRDYIWLGIMDHGMHRPVFWREFVEDYSTADPPLALVVDRVAKLVFVGGGSCHDKLAAMIYASRVTESIGDWRDFSLSIMDCTRSDYADRFVVEGMGFMQGSVSAVMGRRTLTIGKGVRMTSEERKAFFGYQLDEVD